MSHHRLYRPGATSLEALRTGLPQNELRRGEGVCFETIMRSRRLQKEFLASMDWASAMRPNQVHRPVLPVDDLTQPLLMVGHLPRGNSRAQIARFNLALTGVGFDLAGHWLRSRGLSWQAVFGVALTVSTFPQRTSLITISPGPNVDSMGHILHDWDHAQPKRFRPEAYDAQPFRRALVMLRSDHRRRSPPKNCLWLV